MHIMFPMLGIAQSNPQAFHNHVYTRRIEPYTYNQQTLLFIEPMAELLGNNNDNVMSLVP